MSRETYTEAARKLAEYIDHAGDRVQWRMLMDNVGIEGREHLAELVATVRHGPGGDEVSGWRK